MCVCLTGAGPPAWSPAQLPGLAPAVLPAPSRSQGKLWQDGGKTVPAAAHNDPVRVATCPFTGQDYTAPSDSARPLLQTDGTHWWFLFDGVDDSLAAAVSWAGSGAGSQATRFYWTNASGRVGVLSYNLHDDWYGFSGSNYSFTFRSVRWEAGFSTPIDSVTHTYCQISGSDYRAYVDGTIGGTTAAAWETPTVIRLGDNGTGTPLAGAIYGHVPAAAAWDDATRGLVEGYLRGLSP